MIPFEKALDQVFKMTYDWETMTTVSEEEIEEAIKSTGWTPEDFRLDLQQLTQDYLDEVDRTLGENS